MTNDVPTRTKFPLLLMAATLAVLVGAVVLVGRATATPPAGVASAILANGNLPDSIRLKFKDDALGFGSGLDVKRILTQRLEVIPGGSLGWHQHGGPLWAVVGSGTLTVYDVACVPTSVPAGAVYFDPGDDTHLGRNESSTEMLVVVVTIMLPDGGAPRIDVPNPGCPIQ